MPDPLSRHPQQQKSTPLERGRHQRRLASSGGWVPIKGEPGTQHLPLSCPRAHWDGTEGRILGSLQTPTPTPALTEYSSDHQAADMAEIDARLKALQEYMNRLDMRS